MEEGRLHGNASFPIIEDLQEHVVSLEFLQQFNNHLLVLVVHILVADCRFELLQLLIVIAL